MLRRLLMYCGTHGRGIINCGTQSKTPTKSLARPLACNLKCALCHDRSPSRAERRVLAGIQHKPYCARDAIHEKLHSFCVTYQSRVLNPPSSSFSTC